MKNKLAIFLLVYLISCSNNNEIKNDEVIIEKTYNLIKPHESKNFSFKEVLDVDWDKVCIFPPYTPTDTIDKYLGFNWKLSNKTHIEHNEGICLVVFIRMNQVVEYLIYPRNKGDFSKLNKRCYLKEEATFTHKEEVNGDKIRYLIQDI